MASRNCCIYPSLPPIELCGEVEGGETDGGGYDLQTVSIGTTSAGGGRGITACSGESTSRFDNSYEPQRGEEQIIRV